MIWKIFGDDNEGSYLEGSKNFAELWNHCKPVIEELGDKLPDPSFKPRIEEQHEANAICERHFGMDLRTTLLVVINGLLRHSTDISLTTFDVLDRHFAAFGITDRMIFYSKEKELHINLIPKDKTEGVLLVQFTDQKRGLTFYYDDCKKGGAIIL
ncbi:MAG TPA: hypothetical protein PLV59_03605 [Candidatus Dojkabacteria bacterium]|nr:hypothetical protein [Candidatus Dojkabacteria bacterium]